jgi:Uma2 family endonuclease
MAAMTTELTTAELAAEEHEISEYELERGKPMPSEAHSYIQLNIGAELRQRYRKTNSVHSELSLELGDLKRTPDISVFPKRSIDFRHDKVRVTDAPILAVEILSPTQVSQDVIDKIDEMLAAGVKACWFVQPALQTVSVFVLNQKPKTITEGVVSDGVSGIELPIDDIFSTE